MEGRDGRRWKLEKIEKKANSEWLKIWEREKNEHKRVRSGAYREMEWTLITEVILFDFFYFIWKFLKAGTVLKVGIGQL